VPGAEEPSANNAGRLDRGVRFPDILKRVAPLIERRVGEQFRVEVLEPIVGSAFIRGVRVSGWLIRDASSMRKLISTEQLLSGDAFEALLVAATTNVG
jgi:hypothetical protein